jgi:hypothetical protein
MKKIYITFLFILFIHQNIQAQLGLGVGVRTGLNFLRSSDFNQAVADIASQNQAQTYEVRSQAGFGMGFNAVIQYRLAHQWQVVAYPGIYMFKALNSSIYKYNNATNTEQYRLESLAKLSNTQFILPISAKYYVIPDRNFFVAAGVQLSIGTKMKLRSEEDSVRNTIVGNVITSTTSYNQSHTVKLNQYKPFQAHLILGAGMSVLTGYYHNLDIELNYLLPITTSYYYTDDATFGNEAQLNKVYSEKGKSSIENATGNSITDFRAHTITLTFRYILYNRVKTN